MSSKSITMSMNAMPMNTMSMNAKMKAIEEKNEFNFRRLVVEIRTADKRLNKLIPVIQSRKDTLEQCIIAKRYLGTKANTVIKSIILNRSYIKKHKMPVHVSLGNNEGNFHFRVKVSQVDPHVFMMGFNHRIGVHGRIYEFVFHYSDILLMLKKYILGKGKAIDPKESYSFRPEPPHDGKKTTKRNLLWNTMIRLNRIDSFDK